MKKLIAFIGIITTLGLGAFLLNSVVPASAGSLDVQSPQQSSTDSGCHTRTSLKDVLDKLVTDGTINSDQENAVIQGLKDAHQANAANRPDRARAPRVRILEGMLTVSADKIGVSVDDLKTALKAGQSVADVATAHNVAPADVQQAIVDAGSTKIDQAVTDGKVPSDKAATMKARLPEMAGKFVNAKRGGGC